MALATPRRFWPTWRNCSINPREPSAPMPTRTPMAFMPPMAEELSGHLDRHAPRGPALWLAWLLLAALAIVVL